jgi:hypothetical protein
MTLTLARLVGFTAPLSALRPHRSPFPAALDAAVDYAYARFAVRYMRWANSLFDYHFLRHYAAGPLIAFADGRLDAQQTAEELVAAWERQHGAERPNPARCHTELAQAASVFVGWLAEGLSRRPRRRLASLLPISWPGSTS